MCSLARGRRQRKRALTRVTHQNGMSHHGSLPWALTTCKGGEQRQGLAPGGQQLGQQCYLAGGLAFQMCSAFQGAQHFRFSQARLRSETCEYWFKTRKKQPSSELESSQFSEGQSGFRFCFFFKVKQKISLNFYFKQQLIQTKFRITM